MSDPTARVLQLLSLLQTYRFWPGPELSARLEVSERTLRRDVDRLRELGYPVEATPGVAGGYRLGAGAHMPPLLLDDDEAVAIAVGLRAAAASSVVGIEDTSVRALAKLEQVLPDRLRRRVAAVHGNVASLRWDGGSQPSVDGAALAVLAQACRDHEQVRFEYTTRDGAEERRLVEPHQLVSAGRRWYLVAWDVRRGDWRTFRVDRLTEPALAGMRFKARELDAAAYVAESIQSMPMPYTAELVVRATPEEVKAVLRWVEPEVVSSSAGRCRVQLRADAREWLTTQVTLVASSFDVESVSPAEVAADVSRVAARLAAVGAD